MNKTITIFIIVSLIGCAPAAYTWKKQGNYSNAILEQDTHMCKHEGEHAAAEIFIQQSKGPEIRGEDILAAEKETFTNCMTSKGWYKVKIKKQ